MLSCFNKFNACLLHFRVYAKDTALVIEGMEQAGQLMHIMGNAVYRALFGCRGNKFRIFAQFFNQFNFCRVGQQSIIGFGRFFNAGFLKLAENAANTRMCVLNIVNRVFVGFFRSKRQVKIQLAVDAAHYKEESCCISADFFNQFI